VKTRSAADIEHEWMEASCITFPSSAVGSVLQFPRKHIHAGEHLPLETTSVKHRSQERHRSIGQNGTVTALQTLAQGYKRVQHVKTAGLKSETEEPPPDHRPARLGQGALLSIRTEYIAGIAISRMIDFDNEPASKGARYDPPQHNIA
jgi:hypothetical protein